MEAGLVTMSTLGWGGVGWGGVRGGWGLRGIPAENKPKVGGGCWLKKERNIPYNLKVGTMFIVSISSCYCPVNDDQNASTKMRSSPSSIYTSKPRHVQFYDAIRLQS